MALSVTGIDPATGRVVPKGTNVLIPKENAGIGDLVYKNGANIRIVGRGTASASSISIGGTTYTLYGCIYGFVSGMAMIVAPNAGETSCAWLSSGSSTVGPEYGLGTVLMRNGIKCTYAQMNTARQSSNDDYRGAAGTNVHPTASLNGGVMTESTFNSNTNNVKSYYTSWEEYLRQTLRVNGVPGTPFGAVADGVKVHEFGRWMTKQVVTTHGSAAVAAYHCYNDYKGALGTDPVGTWWLPSMFELGELMIDEHLNKVNENSAILSVRASENRWSCVRINSVSAWTYINFGMSDSYGGFDNSFMARPVTLLKLV